MNANVNAGKQHFKLPNLGKIVTLSNGDAFERIIPFTLAYEGGESNDANDPGGWTRFGWTLKTFLTLSRHLADFDGDGDVDSEDFRQLSEARSVPLYRAVFFDRYSLGMIGTRTAAATFDAMVNTGPARGARFLQLAFNALPLRARENAMCLGLAVDGAIGPRTIAAVAKACAWPGVDAELARTAMLRRAAYYDSIRDLPVTKDGVVGYPFRKFHGGLMTRVRDHAAFQERAFQP